MTRAEAVEVTRQRRDWLTARIRAKQSVGWCVEWDTRERDAHTRVLLELGEDHEERQVVA